MTPLSVARRKVSNLEAHIYDLLMRAYAAKFVGLSAFFMERPVIILGAHGLGRVALDILQQNGSVVYGFLDDDPTLQGKK